MVGAPIAATLSPELEANILKVLCATHRPMTPAAILKALPVGGRPKPKVLKEWLARMEPGGAVARVPPESDKYVNGPIAAWVSRAVMTELAAGPQTRVKLLKFITVSHGDLLDETLASLVASGAIHLHPPPTKAGHPAYGLGAPDPITYLAKDIDKLLKTAVGKGFSAAAVRQALHRYFGDSAAHSPTAIAPPVRPALSLESVVAAMRRLEPRIDHGAAVPIGKLRSALGDSGAKDVFDAALMALAASGVIELQSHAWPERLSAGERESLVDNGRGGWFDSAALRHGSAS
jgi:hypothetical protein